MFKIISIIILSFFIGCGSPSTFKPNTDVGSGGKNLAPTATPKSVILSKNSSIVIDLTGDDPNGDALTPIVVTQPKHGTYKDKVYIPNVNYKGSDSFSFTVHDGSLTSAPATVTITVTDDSAQPSACKSLPKTGQTITYHNNDDGDLQKGATRSYTRDDANGIVTDNVTGLMWQDNESVQKPWVTQANYDAKNYMDTSGDTATTYCENLVLGSYGDWRLPTRKELYYLTDKGRENPSIDPIFQSSVSDYYWSSSTTADDSSNAWVVVFYDGVGTWYSKDGNRYVRCVRAGQ